MSGKIGVGIAKDLIEILDGLRKHLSDDERESVEFARKRVAEVEAEEKSRLTPHDYQLAIHSQSACNLSGIVHSFSEVISRIWNEARALGEGTDFVNRHPISRLFAEQIAHLSGAGSPVGGSNDWSKAHEVCEAEAKKAVAAG